jgi:hypothetical protein
MFPTRLLTSEDECKWFWHQMIYFPGTINTVSTGYIITLQWILCQLSSYARWLTLCMLVSLSREGVVFLVFLPYCHFTEIHVLPPPVSEANWRFLSRPGVSPPPFLFQDGVFIHRVHTLSLPRVRHSVKSTRIIFVQCFNGISRDCFLWVEGGGPFCRLSRCRQRKELLIVLNFQWLLQFYLFFCLFLAC